MELVVISPEGARADEISLVERMCTAGLQRYHVRKPTWSREQTAAWLQRVSPSCRAWFVLHQHHELAAPFGLRGCHWPERQAEEVTLPQAGAAFTSRSCHDVDALRRSLGRFDSVFFGPVFPSLSKPGYVPRTGVVTAVSTLLDDRSPTERSTAVIAIGGVTTETAIQARAFGFDGVAVLGAVWQAPDPLAAFATLRNACVVEAAPVAHVS